MILFLTLDGTVSFAQNSIFAGKVLDEKNKPVSGARIKLSRGGNAIDELMTDEEGLYYSQMLSRGNYNLDVVANGKYLRSKKIYLKAHSDETLYYNLRMHDDKLEIEETSRDPFLAVKLEKMNGADPRGIIDMGGRQMGFFRTDTNGKVIQASSRPEAPGKMR